MRTVYDFQLLVSYVVTSVMRGVVAGPSHFSLWVAIRAALHLPAGTSRNKIESSLSIRWMGYFKMKPVLLAALLSVLPVLAHGQSVSRYVISSCAGQKNPLIGSAGECVWQLDTQTGDVRVCGIGNLSKNVSCTNWVKSAHQVADPGGADGSVASPVNKK